MGLLNLRNALMAGKRTPTARDYNYDLALWDAIENAGYGIHDASATSITNLLGGGLDITLSGNYAVNANNIRFDGGYGTADKYDFTDYDAVTISYLASFDSTAVGNACGWSYAGTAPRIVPYWQSGGWFFNTYASTTTKISSTLAPNATTKLDFVFDAKNQACLLYKNGVIEASQSGRIVFGNMKNRFYMMSYGSNKDTLQEHYNGNIYNCAVSTRAMTASEIAANYAIDKARFGLP